MAASSAWMKDIQDRMKKATSEVNVALQPRVAVAKRSLEEGMQSIGLRHGKEIFDEDEDLLAAVTALDDLRALLTSLSRIVDAHRRNLLAVAATERQLGELLSTPSAAVTDILQSHVAPARIDAQAALGVAQVHASTSLSRFALDMATPMVDLSRNFEERFVSSIAPLKKLYIYQKAEYVKFAKQAASCEEPPRREALEATAAAARPVWERTSVTLRSEIQSVVAYTISNMSEWMLNVAQAEAETYKRSAAALESPAQQAEICQLEYP